MIECGPPPPSLAKIPPQLAWGVTGSTGGPIPHQFPHWFYRYSVPPPRTLVIKVCQRLLQVYWHASQKYYFLFLVGLSIPPAVWAPKGGTRMQAPARNWRRVRLLLAVAVLVHPRILFCTPPKHGSNRKNLFILRKWRFLDGRHFGHFSGGGGLWNSPSNDQANPQAPAS